MTIEVQFTGEFFVPGKSGPRIEADHIERYRFAARYAQDKSVLDIACGVGYAAPILLAANARSYEGVDLNPELTAYAREKYGSERAHFVTGDVCAFNPGTQYDLVTCFETIEHVANYQQALENLWLLLAPRGKLLISSPNRPVSSPAAATLHDKPSNKYHTQEFMPGELAAALQAAGFSLSGQFVYGQRRRWFPPAHLFARLAQRIVGDPDEVTSAVVGPVGRKIPLYFVLVADKPDVDART
jgi:SAM-dependent methyltransferase